MNAFSLLQGGIYIHAGLLARLDNEAQLAHVLAHEITHTVKRHQLKFVRSMKNKTVAAKLAEIVLAPAAGAFAGGGGANLISTLIGLTYAASVTGYGRENEEEAAGSRRNAVHAGAQGGTSLGNGRLNLLGCERPQYPWISAKRIRW
jgi:predicted Zn-dependent protease